MSCSCNKALASLALEQAAGMALETSVFVVLDRELLTQDSAVVLQPSALDRRYLALDRQDTQLSPLTQAPDLPVLSEDRMPVADMVLQYHKAAAFQELQHKGQGTLLAVSLVVSS